MDAERPVRSWKWTANVAILTSVCWLAVLVIIVAIPLRMTRLTDDRLIGTWQSDAERTIAGIRAEGTIEPEREAKLRNLFGKMRITYTTKTYTTELDDSVVTYSYQLLGRDKHSVVFCDSENKESPLAFLELSTFTVIHFDSPDSYWLDTEIGGIREYFKRIR